MISGFIICGVLAGPDVLGFVTEADLPVLRFIDYLALPFIAIAAGAELHFDTLRGRFRAIFRILTALVIGVMTFTAAGFLLLAERISFMQGMPFPELLAVSLLAGTVMVAKSPSSTIAVIKELRAKGTFTQTVLGITVVMDMVVIVLFAIIASVAGVLVRGQQFDTSIVFFLCFEIALNFCVGIAVGQILRVVFWFPIHQQIKGVALLGVGVMVFLLHALGEEKPELFFSLHPFSEPLLITMIAGFYVANFTRYRSEIHRIVEELAPAVFIIFFVAAGIGLDVDVLLSSSTILLVLFVMRLAGMFLGASVGSALSGEKLPGGQLLGFAFVTQAGINLGLARQIGVSFPQWGNEFVSLLVAVIVLNTLVGPSFFKFALFRVKEAHPKGGSHTFDGEHHAFIFGVEQQSLALAKQLDANGWNVKMVSRSEERVALAEESGFQGSLIGDLTKESLSELGLEQADSVVAMLDGDTNYRLCELVYEHFGIENIVVRLTEDGNVARFYDLGVLVVDHETAIVNLLDHSVRSPSAVSLVLGREVDKDVVEMTVRNPSVHGLALRDLTLPGDALILAIRRKGNLLLSHGYTRLRTGDEVTVVGTKESLKEIQLRLG